MEVLRTEDFYIFVSGQNSLWWDRQTGVFVPKSGWELTSADDPICIGICYGIVGKVQHSTVFDTRLLLVKDADPIGKIHGNNIVFKIKSVTFLQLNSQNTDAQLHTCPKHKSIDAQRGTGGGGGLFDLQKNAAFTKTWGTLKSAGNSLKSTTQQAAAIATGIPKRRNSKDKEKFEKRIVDEFYKIFTDTESFYFCKTTDITNSLQRLCDLEKAGEIEENALWKTVDDRFFWNKYMLKDFIESHNPLIDPWILPIIQGYVQIEECEVELDNDYQGVMVSPKHEIFTLSLISRRSRFRAGTRYKRRGVDETGECANYVETEQLIAYKSHEVSFVQVRGSVPVFWSQPGYKYRPPPRIDKGEAETQLAFSKHFNKELSLYHSICIINLVEQSGKERIIWDAYSNHIFQFNHPQITYCTFDFHEYCRGMHFENVSILISSIAEIIKEMNYCWRDRQGHICSQVGVFRVNCIDCLDRTNVVQTALAKAVMEIQFTKLGLISPDGLLPASIKKVFQLLWANNGDIISKQYAGTNALKGDYTRTGERKFTGIMKDGVNSANRYFIQHFKDSTRQYCLDVMLGNDSSGSDVPDGYWDYACLVGNIAGELLPDTPPPTYIPHIALTQEFELANALYYMSRYYLSRFKDSTRQGTIDLMLGNCVTEDIFSDSKVQQEEEDNVATAEHVKLLIEDCKKMLINSPELVVGSWGLINADPSTGDPSETEMDSILILTRDSYYVADYDDQVDKITKYQRVMLRDVSLLESGLPDTVSLFKSSKAHYSIRINYKLNETAGYFHMFRSTQLRFFNNMAVAIKNDEEGIESLKSICEAFQVGMDIAGLEPIPYHQGVKLDKKKSRVVSNSSTGGIYLDVVGFPNLTRNVSESQLLALKSAGSKALSNVQQKFSKLNKLSSQLVPKKAKPNQTKFMIGDKSGSRNESSSDSDEDYENSIFQPNIAVETGMSQYGADNSGSSTSKLDYLEVEQGVELTESTEMLASASGGKVDSFLPGVGIVMGSTAETDSVSPDMTSSVELNERSSNVDDERLSSVIHSISLKNHSELVSSGPKIQVDLDLQQICSPNTLKFSSRKLSRSSSDIDNFTGESKSNVVDSLIDRPGGSVSYTVGHLDSGNRSVSQHDITLNICQSQSESALKHKLTNLTSPVASVTKDLVLSPFSKFAKGVQFLGSNLDPRKLSISGASGGSGGGGRTITEQELEEHRQLQKKWMNCNTRLIAL